jgi:phosphate uptake regulator/aminoglycoside phosphotransferase
MIVPEGIEENLRFLIVEVRKQIEKARRFLAKPSRKLLDSLHAKDDYIDNLKSIIQRKCFQHAIRDADIPQPEIDLLKAIEITSVNLERIADFCENISAQAEHIIESGVLDNYDFDPMFNMVLEGLDKVEDAIFKQEVQIALSVCRAEDELDLLYARAFHGCIEDMRQGGDPAQIVTVIFLYRYLERMGDSLLNIGEAVISTCMGERIKIDRFWALQDTLDSSNLQDLKESLRSVAMQPIGETRSGCRISRVQSNKGGRAVIFKEGKLSKLEDERASIEQWHKIMPGLAPQVHSFHEHEDNGSLLFEFLPGETFDRIVIARDIPLVEKALREICTVLHEVWSKTRATPGKPAGYMKQLKARLADVYELHPDFQQDSWGVDGLAFESLEEQVKRAAELEEAVLTPPFSVFIHGDFNMDNIIYNDQDSTAHFIDLHRSRHTDYVQDVSVFIVSNQRKQIFENRIRRRLNHVAASFCEFARGFAQATDDTYFEARLALGLARSYVTSARFVLDEEFARYLFQRARYLLARLLEHPPTQLETFRIPEEVLVD